MALKDLLIGVGLDTSKLPRQLGQMERQIKQTAAGFNKMGDNINRNITLPVALAGVASLKLAADFDDSMREVQAIGGGTEATFKKLSDAAMEAGKTTRYTATESGQALKYMALAGWDAEKSISALPGVLNTAAAAGMDLASASDIMTDTMSAFKIEASDANMVADMFAKTQSKANTSVLQLGEAMKYVAADANASNQSLSTTNTMLGIFADQGVKGSQAGTTLSAMFRDMKAKAKDGSIAIGDMNVALYDADGNMRDMVDIMSDVARATVGMTGEQRDFAMSQIFSERSIRGANMAIAAGEERMKYLRSEIVNSTGKAQEMADVMEGGIGGSMRKLRSAAEGLAIQMGNHLIPVMENIITNVSAVIDYFSSMDEGTHKLIISLGVAAASVGVFAKGVGVAMNIASSMTGVVKLFTISMTGATRATVAMNMAMKATTIGALIAVVAGAVLVFKSISDAMDDTTHSQRLLTEATHQANVETAMEVGTLKKVTEKLNESKRSREDIKTAIEDLQKINPTYFKNLDKEKSTYAELVSAVDDYTASIKRSAETRVLTQMLEDAFKDVEEFKNTLRDPSLWDKAKVAITAAFPDIAELVGFDDFITKGTEAAASINPLIDRLNVLNTDAIAAAGSLNKVGGDGDGEGEESAEEKRLKAEAAAAALLAKEIERLKEARAAELAVMSGTTLEEEAAARQKINDVAGVALANKALTVESMTAENGIRNEAIEVMRMQGEALTALTEKEIMQMNAATLSAKTAEFQGEAWKMSEGILTEAANSGAKSLTEFANAALKAGLRAAKAFAIEGIFAAVKSAMVNVPFPFNIVAAGLAAGATAVLFNTLESKISPPKLAKGGLAYGETLATVGEYSGAGSNPEVIAPLDKLTGIIRNSIGNAGNVFQLSGDFRLRGQDLILSEVRSRQTQTRLGFIK